MLSRVQESIQLWKERIPKYRDPHFATTPVGRDVVRVNPEKVDPLLFGHHISCVFEKGLRTWAFEGQGARDRFLREYHSHGAKACQNPYPPEHES